MTLSDLSKYFNYQKPPNISKKMQIHGLVYYTPLQRYTLHDVY